MSMKNVYITKSAKFLPNEPISNDEMGEVLGILEGSSKVKAIILRNNGILNRHYAIDKNGNITHNNAEVTFEAIKGLIDDNFKMDDIELLSVGTSSPDQNMPSHAAMVHGLMKSRPIEINSSAGICCAGMSALKYAFMSVKSNMTNNAVAAGSERISTWLYSNKFENEIETVRKLNEKPVLAFEKEFLRWMLSDGSGAFLLENEPNPKSKFNLKIEWMESMSYAGKLDVCMYAAADKLEDGTLNSWSHYSSKEWGEQSIFSIKQDVKLLDKHIIQKGVESLKAAFEKNNLNPEEIDHFLPHISSFYFKDKLLNCLQEQGLNISEDKMFTNLDRVGNVGAGSIYLML